MKQLLFASTMLLLACGGSPKTPGGAEVTGASAGGEAGHGCGESCPMHVTGVSVAYEDTADGAAIVFTTDQGEVAELQSRVAKKAEHHNAPEPKRGEGHIPHSARADNIERGARLVMTPADPKDLEALRAHVREHVEHMQKGGCPHGHGGHHEGHGGHHDAS